MAWIERSEVRGPVGTFDELTAKELPAGSEPTARIGGSPEFRTVEFGIPAARLLPAPDAVPADQAIGGFVDAPETETAKAVRRAVSQGVAAGIATVLPTAGPVREGLAAYFDFSETDPTAFASKDGAFRGVARRPAGGGTVTKVDDPHFGSVADFNGYLSIPAAETGALHLSAYTDEMTVAAWVKMRNDMPGFIAGMWQENNNDPRRQYGLFVNLSGFGGNRSVCTHVTRTGGADPGSIYNRTMASTSRRFAPGEWRFMVGTYDVRTGQLKSWLDATTDEYPNYTEPTAPSGDGRTYSKNPLYFDEGLNRLTPPCDFTIGAVQLTNGMSNYLMGSLARLWIYSRALSAEEIMKIYLATKPKIDPLIRLDSTMMSTATVGATYAPTLYGFKAVRGVNATPTEDLPAGYRNYVFVLPNGSPRSFMYRSVESGAILNETERAFGYIDTLGGLRFSQFDRFTFVLNNSHASITNRFCVKIGTQWFATDAEFSVSGDGRVGADWNQAELKTVMADRTGSRWRDMTFVRGTTLSIADTARTAKLPNGEVTGIGIYTPPMGPAPKTFRIDDINLW